MGNFEEQKENGFKAFTLRLPKEVYELLRAFSFFTEKPMNQIIIEMIGSAGLEKKVEEMRNKYWN